MVRAQLLSCDGLSACFRGTTNATPLWICRWTVRCERRRAGLHTSEDAPRLIQVRADSLFLLLSPTRVLRNGPDSHGLAIPQMAAGAAQKRGPWLGTVADAPAASCRGDPEPPVG